MDLGIFSYILGVAEATYKHFEIQNLWETWRIEEYYISMVFVCLGYIRGAHHRIKPRNESGIIYIDEA